MKLEKVTDGAKEATKRWYDDACGTALALALVGERWALLVMRELLLGPRRFGELRASLPGISANVLTQRLEGLEANGIVRRERLPPPANVQVYALTDWGLESEGMILEMGRWALRSPLHDPTLPFSATALVLSLRMLLVPARAEGMEAVVGIHCGIDHFTVRVTGGALELARGDDPAADTVIAGAPNDFLPVMHGGLPVASSRLTVTGDDAVARRFLGLFQLPTKVGAALPNA
jgi:DNA-binding HxlR family transcriptional regulator